MPLHTYGRNLALDLLLDGDYEIGLSFSDPDVLLNEPSGGAYARQAITGADWADASGGAKRNSSAIVFPTATADWGDTPLRYFFVATPSGDVIGSGTLNKARRIYDGYTPRFPANSIVISYPTE